METALAALGRDPEQLSIQYEMDKLTFDWQQHESAFVSAQLNQQFVAKAYAQTENETALKRHEETSQKKVPFNTTG